MKFDRKSGRLVEVERRQPIGARVVDMEKFKACVRPADERKFEESPMASFLIGLLAGAIAMAGLISALYILHEMFAR